MSETEKKPRKPRTPKEKAPSRKDNPAGYQMHYLQNAIANVTKRDNETTSFGIVGLGGHFGDALHSLQNAYALLATVPSDFRVPRKRGGGGGRPAKRFTAGQRVNLSDKALAVINQIFPSVNNDNASFSVYDKQIVSEGTKLYSIEGTVDGERKYVGFVNTKDLTAVA